MNLEFLYVEPMPPPEHIVTIDDISDENYRLLSIYDAINGRMGDEPSLERIHFLLEKFENQTAITAVDSDEHDIAGVANVYFDNRNSQTFIDGIATHPDYAGEGVGSQLMEYIEQQTAHRELGRVALQSIDKAVGFYEKLGYHHNNKHQTVSHLHLMTKTIQ